jgi:prepilin-type N-terminal cleavage/methylation domain-containing protein
LGEPETMARGNNKKVFSPACERGFTLVELLVVIGVVLILASLSFLVGRTVLDRANEAKNIGNLRTIGVGITAFAADRNGHIWTREDIGFSSYRAVDDPLGLPILLEDYIDTPKVWVNPAGRPSLKDRYGNTYAWTRAANVTTKPLSAIARRAGTVLVWDNHTMTLPSVHNVPEPPTGGPRAASAAFRHFPHRNGKALGWLYSDGSVRIR